MGAWWMGARSDIVLSIDSRPLVTLENVQHVILLGLTIQECRGDGIHLNGGSDCLLADCTLRRLGGGVDLGARDLLRITGRQLRDPDERAGRGGPALRETARAPGRVTIALVPKRSS